MDRPNDPLTHSYPNGLTETILSYIEWAKTNNCQSSLILICQVTDAPEPDVWKSIDELEKEGKIKSVWTGEDFYFTIRNKG